MMIDPHPERGAALLTVLLLVAVMATLAATALDRLSLATRLVGNAAVIGQARSWLATAELLAATRIEDLLAADSGQTRLAGNWLGVERRIALPDGASVRARLEDGGNCFNLNSLVETGSDGALTVRPLAGEQFAALMRTVGIEPGKQQSIAAATSDYLDSDSVPLPGGGEDRAAQLAANRLMADASELRLIAGVGEREYGLLERWICALPVAELSPINVNTLLPEQAPLLAMLAPGRLDLGRARSVLAARPADGFGSVLRFWQSPLLEGVQVAPEAAKQVRVRTDFFTLRATVAAGELELSEVALIDARAAPARIVRREWGEAS